MQDILGDDPTNPQLDIDQIETPEVPMLEAPNQERRTSFPLLENLKKRQPMSMPNRKGTTFPTGRQRKRIPRTDLITPFELSS